MGSAEKFGNLAGDETFKILVLLQGSTVPLKIIYGSEGKEERVLALGALLESDNQFLEHFDPNPLF